MNDQKLVPFSFRKILLFVFLYFFLTFVLVLFTFISTDIKIFINNNFLPLSNILDLLVLFYLFKFYKKETWRNINRKDARVIKVFLLGFATIIIQYGFAIIVLLLLGDAQVMKDHAAYDNEVFQVPLKGNIFVWSLLTISTVCFIAPLFEELFFRGIIFTYFRSKMPTMLAIFLSAILFGIGHGYESNIIWATMLGIFFAWIYYKTNNIFYSLTAHIFVNTFNLFFMILLMKNS